jgi:hypothetical protein
MPFSEIKCYDVTNVIFGATGDGSTDDANAIQDAVNAILADYGTNGYNTGDNIPPTTPEELEIGVYARSMPVLYFPPGIYRISKTINFSDGLGMLKVLGDDAIIRPMAGLFTGDYGFNFVRGFKIRIEGLTFLQFKGNVDIAVRVGRDAGGSETGQTVADGCNFQACSLALQLEGHTSVVANCKFIENTKAMITYGEKAVVRDSWITTGQMPRLEPPAPNDPYVEFRPCQIENYGLLHFETMVLVPMQQPAEPIEPAWINNYASVTANSVRQGGEKDSFVLINNFAGNSAAISGKEPNAIIVQNSACYAVYTNEPGILQPAILRYVSGIPNLTTITNNTGLIDCRILGFSYEAFGDNTAAINAMIAGSGNPYPPNEDSVCVEVVNNVGSVRYNHGSYVPLELYPFVRNKDSFWPQKQQISLEPLDVNVVAGGGSTPSSITYKFEYPGWLDSGTAMLSKTQFMINYTGCPNPGGFVGYSGLFVGYLKAIGFYNGAVIGYRLYLETVANHISVLGLPGSYTVTLYWEATNTTELPVTASNFFFYIKIEGRAGATSEYDRIALLPLFNI